ncbi:DUF2871 family protein [Paenibacillus macerans]|uniref:DUF2871 family protein n=1 Tax=Paenibacillus macerans TaxID=44252 RepID=UPI003D31CCFD
MLGALHTHLLALGFLFFLIVLCLGKLFDVHEAKSFGAWYAVYNLGLLVTVGTMAARGMLQVDGNDLSALPYIAGLGHMILGAGIVWLLVLLGRRVR